MVDLEVIQNRLRGLRELIQILKEHQSLSREDFTSRLEKQLATQHALQLAIQHRKGSTLYGLSGWRSVG